MLIFATQGMCIRICSINNLREVRNSTETYDGHVRKIQLINDQMRTDRVSPTGPRRRAPRTCPPEDE